jgi:ADP-ribosylglycohydrolase
MPAATAGDVIGSVYEHRPVKHNEFPLFTRHPTFTDDTVPTVALAHAILRGEDYGLSMKPHGRRYSGAGYGRPFFRWLMAAECRSRKIQATRFADGC